MNKVTGLGGKALLWPESWLKNRCYTEGLMVTFLNEEQSSVESLRGQHQNCFYQYLQQCPGEGNEQWHFAVCRKQGHLKQKGWQVSFSIDRHEVKKNLKSVYMVLTSELILKLVKEILKKQELTVLWIIGSVCSGSQKSLQNLGQNQDGCFGQDRKDVTLLLCKSSAVHSLSQLCQSLLCIWKM